MIIGLLSIISIGYFFVTLFTYTYNYLSLKKEEKSLAQELNNVEKEKSDLKVEIQKLNDPEYVARYAKEKFLYSEKDEYVIKLDDEPVNQEEEKISHNDIYIIIGSSIIFVLVILIIKKNSSKK